MAQRRNVFTRMGRPPTPKPIAKTFAVTGEKAGASPMENFDARIPAQAFDCGGSVKRMPKYHPDPGFCGGGSTKRR
jgi:hypothetical protein